MQRKARSASFTVNGSLTLNTSMGLPSRGCGVLLFKRRQYLVLPPCHGRMGCDGQPAVQSASAGALRLGHSWSCKFTLRLASERGAFRLTSFADRYLSLSNLTAEIIVTSSTRAKCRLSLREQVQISAATCEKKPYI